MRKFFKPWVTKALLVIVFVGLSTLLAAGYISHRIVTESNDFRLSDNSEIPVAQAALVLGARVYEGGGLSITLADRMDAGIELYKSRKVDKLLLSGDHRADHYDETNAMKNYALKHGVPAEDIFLDHAGFRTYDSLYRARDVFGIEKLIVVTQEFHLDRAIYTGRMLGLDVYGLACDRRVYYNHRYNKLREFLARSKAFIDIHILSKKPHFLGPKVDITGDGRQTHD
ncbi:MAG: YdcF family protein [Spirochaetota bacterium]|nr:YdcF family protein [Spirochaetota bacterium]